MNESPAAENSGSLDALRRYIPLAEWVVAILTLLLIPLKIIGYGYIPGDDALRHAAKAVSGKSWSDVLVLNDAYKIDHEFGWSLLLEKIHGWTGADAEGLMIFSVVSLFVLGGLAALPWLRRPEAWLPALALAMIASLLPYRFLLGRPFMVTIAALFALLLLWRRFGDKPPKAWMLAVMTGLFTASVYIHGTWYLWVLPLAAFFIAGQFRWWLAASGCWAGGVVLGSLLTGHPVAYPLQAVKVALLTTGMHSTQRTLVSELAPSGGDINCLVILGGLLVLRSLLRLNSPKLARDPVFWLIALTWTLGFKVGRFWDDWGWPAMLVMVACDLELVLAARFAADSFRRLALAVGLALITFLAITGDVKSRWTFNLAEQFLTQDNPDLKGWLPEKGGILYSADMDVFYKTFYKNPQGDWRYITGFEATLMPREDFEVYHKILWNFGDAKAYAPWILKMKPADRLVMRSGRGGPPNIPQLDWNYGVSGIWVGRLPRPATNDAPVTVPATESRASLTNAASSPK